MLLAALEAVRVPSSTCTNRLLPAVLEELEDSGTTQKEDIKKTPAKMLPSILHVYYTHFCFVNDHGNSVKVEKLNISSYSVKLTVGVLIIKYFVSTWFSYMTSN